MNSIRTEMVLGSEAMELLGTKKVIVFGVGGVGGSAMESLCRLGVAQVTVVDKDVVDETNVNRQLLATEETVGRRKVDVAVERMKAIRPEGDFVGIFQNVTPRWVKAFDFTSYDGILDCIDNVEAKLALYEGAREQGVTLISAMGTGNKTDPSKLLCTTLEKTKMDPLARVLRRECRKRGITGIPVVTSTEEPRKAIEGTSTPGSTPFVPPAAGLLMGSLLMKHWLGER